MKIIGTVATNLETETGERQFLVAMSEQEIDAVMALTFGAASLQFRRSLSDSEAKQFIERCGTFARFNRIVDSCYEALHKQSTENDQ